MSLIRPERLIGLIVYEHKQVQRMLRKVQVADITTQV